MRRDLAEIKRLVEEQVSSGMTVAEFCAMRGVEQKRFYVWRQRVRKAGEQGTERFSRVEALRRVELELGNGVKVRVAPEDLRAVLEALG